MDIQILAAIDIGSNGVRLLIKTVAKELDSSPVAKKTTLVRVPIRLGADVFVEGKVSERNIKRMLQTMKSFDLLMKANEVDAFRACATSAMREAANGGELVAQIKRQTGIDIEIIDGEDEAVIIASTDLYDIVQSDKNYLYVDVGGGSTEFTVFSKGNRTASRSFNIGTVRLLHNLVREKTWREAEKWVRKQTSKFSSLQLIGSGGNINHIYKYSGRKRFKPLTYKYLSSYYQLITSLTYAERVAQLEMKLDRADVIVPATHIYLSAMVWSGARKIHVPKIGLADGIIKMLYN